jgi:hypothetical protein
LADIPTVTRRVVFAEDGASLVCVSDDSFVQNSVPSDPVAVTQIAAVWGSSFPNICQLFDLVM